MQFRIRTLLIFVALSAIAIVLLPAVGNFFIQSGKLHRCILNVQLTRAFDRVSRLQTAESLDSVYCVDLELRAYFSSQLVCISIGLKLIKRHTNGGVLLGVFTHRSCSGTVIFD